MVRPIITYPVAPAFERRVAYFSMEFAVDQALKIYSGGLGFLAGSHIRSAYELGQNLVGVGILWKYGYYDQQRDTDTSMKPAFVEKDYSFLEDTRIVFSVTVHDAPVYVKALLLRPETFRTAPLYLLTTDIPENDFLSRSVTHRLYDSNEATRIAQSIILGAGGARLMELLDFRPDVYHMNEGHALPLAFHLYRDSGSLSAVREKLVFTTHTPEAAGNEEHRYGILEKMSFFQGLREHQVRDLLGLDGPGFNYTLAALKLARRANGVSELHAGVARRMWSGHQGICEIMSVTNAQNRTYWADAAYRKHMEEQRDDAVRMRKKELKQELFKVVADQTGKLFQERTCTLVWARRFAGYKRADLLLRDWTRFTRLIQQTRYPLQIIWAGKPYPEDHSAIRLFNEILHRVRYLPNCAVLVGYELHLSGLLKKGSDLWLNNPVRYREASGTSGMTAAMNGSVNLSIPDGWIPEFARDRENSFIIPPAPDGLPPDQRDDLEAAALYDLLEHTILPMYYEQPEKWLEIVKTAFRDITPAFEAGRMAGQYYSRLYDDVPVTVS